MKSSIKLAALASLALTQLIPAIAPARASTFTETEIDQAAVIAITKPYGEDKFDLLVVEQIPEKKQCWAESGSNPVIVEPLLLKFDFTGICRRATDSNGYSIRIDGKDYGLDYLLRLVPRGGELVLVATSRVDPKQPEITIGHTRGMVRGFMKIQLNPGWKFSKRTYGTKVLGHYYFSGSAAALESPAEPAASIGSPAEPATNIESPAEPATSIESPAEPAASIESPAEPATSIESPAEPAASIESPPAKPEESVALPVVPADNKSASPATDNSTPPAVNSSPMPSSNPSPTPPPQSAPRKRQPSSRSPLIQKGWPESLNHR